MHKYGMSFLTGFGSGPDNYYSTLAGVMTGNPPFSFGGVFAVPEDGSATEQAVWGNLNTTAAPDEGWLLKVDGQWQLLPSQVVEGVMGALTLDAGITPLGSQTRITGAGLKALFVVVCTDGSGAGSNAYIYVNGNLVDTVANSTGPLMGTDEVRLGFTPSDLALNPFGGYINMVFYEGSCLSAITVRQLWQQLQNYGRLSDSADLDYVWQAYHNPNVSATWTSRGSAATPMILTRTGTDMSVEYWSRVSWGSVVVADAASSDWKLTPTQTSEYDAVCNEAVAVDPTAGGFPVNFPAAPAAGCTIRIFNVGSSLNAITVDGGTNDVEDPDLSLAAMGTTATLTGDGFSYDFMYTGTFWKVV